MFTLKQVSQKLNVSESTLLSEIRRGNLTGQKIGSQWRFARRDLERFLGIERTSDLFGPRETTYQAIDQRFLT